MEMIYRPSQSPRAGRVNHCYSLFYDSTVNSKISVAQSVALSFANSHLELMLLNITSLYFVRVLTSKHGTNNRLLGMVKHNRNVTKILNLESRTEPMNKHKFNENISRKSK